MNILDIFKYHVEFDETKSYDWLIEYTHNKELIGLLFIRNKIEIEIYEQIILNDQILLTQYPDTDFKVAILTELTKPLFDNFQQLVKVLGCIEDYSTFVVLHKSDREWYYNGTLQ